MEQKFTVSSTPHIRSKDTIDRIMLDVLIALAPATLVGIFYFGYKAALVIILAVASAVLSEWGFQKITKRPITIMDFSACVTGLLLALNLPSTVPFWIPIVGSFVAIVLIKQLFGGLGQNFLNPALGARAFLLSAYPTQMTDWINPLTADAASSATPLELLKKGFSNPVLSDYINTLIGHEGGCIGEGCAIAIIAGGIYLIVRRVINWRTPVAFIGSVAIFTWIFGRNGAFTGAPLYEILVGGVMLGAFFMATDYSTSPVTPTGQLIMGIACGFLTGLIRVYGGYPEGVSYSILIMNLVVPLIDRFVKPRVFGTTPKKLFKARAKEGTK